MLQLSKSHVAGGLDHFALLAFLAFIVVHLTGGFAIEVGAISLSARSQDRPLVIAVAALVLRLLLDRTTPPPAAWRTFLNRVYDPRADDPRAAWPAPRWPEYGLALAGFCAFGLVLLWFQVSRLDAIPEIGDPLFSVWRVSWVYRQLLGDPRDLFDANIFHPRPLTLTYSDSMLLPALTTVPLIAAGVHPIVAMNTILVLSFVASAFTMYLLVVRLTASSLPAFVSGLIFGFYPYRYDHYIHFELLMTYCLPLVLLAVHRFVDTLKIRDAALAVVAAIAQLYSSMYLAVLLMWQLVGMGTLILVLYRPRIDRLVVPALIGAVLAGALAWPLVNTYTSAQLEERSTREMAFYSAEPRDYLQPHPRSALWGANAEPSGERALFPGLMAIALTLVGLTRRLGRIRVLYLVGLLIAFEMSLGANSQIYLYLYEWLTFMRGMRAPARAGFLFGLALAVLAGYGVQRLVAGRSQAAGGAIVAALTIAIGVDLRPTVDLQTAWPSPPNIYRSIKPTDVLAEFPMGSLTAETILITDTPYMYFSIWHGAQLINGYSGHLPPDHIDFLTAMEALPEPSAIQILRERGATHITINCLFYRGCGRLIERVDRSPDLRPVSSEVWQGRAVQLYELRPKP